MILELTLAYVLYPYALLIDTYFRDKSKYTLSPMGQQNLSKGAMIPPEPNVDFEFHVKIFIKGGKCVLHTSKGSEEEKRKMKKDKSFSGKILLFTLNNVSDQSICVVVRSTPTHCAGVHTVCREGAQGNFLESVRCV